MPVRASLQVREQTCQTCSAERRSAAQIRNLDNQLGLSVFFQRRNETIKNPGGKIKRGAGGGGSCSCSPVPPPPPPPAAGRVRAEGSALSAIVSAASETQGAGTRRCSGAGRRLCHDGHRSAAGGPAAAGGAAADCGRHHHRAALHHRAQLGKVAKWVRDRKTRGRIAHGIRQNV